MGLFIHETAVQLSMINFIGVKSEWESQLYIRQVIQ
jgi:hypothetical protein